MEFKKFKKKFQKHFVELTEDAQKLFEVQIDKGEFYDLYLNSFTNGTNNIYKTNREYDCNCCRHFLRVMGGVVVIKNNELHTLWGFDTGSEVFQPVVDALDTFVKRHAVTDFFVSKEKNIGTDQNHSIREDGSVVTFDHFYLQLPDRFVDRTSRSEGEIKGALRDTRNVFKRSLDEISNEAVTTILELVAQNSLYKGEEWKSALTEFKKYKREYDKLSASEKELYAWEKSVTAGPVIGRIRNHSIGVLLTDISEGMDLEEAVKRYEKIVAPSNYKRPKAIFTKKMVEEAQKKIQELGFMNSLGRRFATLDDITVNNILFSNKDSAKRIFGASVFDDMMAEVAVNPKKFTKVEEVTAEKFVNDILPTARELEVFFENKHTGNLVSLIAPEVKDSKTMFKWNNGFSWAYAGNVTDSMKERVKAAGGKVDGDLRFSIQWNEDGDDNCDLDAHCKEADGYEIYYGSAKKPYFSHTKGQLDVDIISPNGKVAVENITWADRKTMKPGKYKFFVHQYSGIARKGFRAEIEFDGQVYSFAYNTSMKPSGDVVVAEVTLDKNGTFSIKEMLPSNVSSREIWNIKTNQFVPVSVVCYSPNYWDEQSGVGHKHYFFMLKNCVNPEEPNGMFNEYLLEDLMPHKRVFEALGSKMHVNSTDDQLSGIGFSSTKRADILVKVKGQTERVVRVKF